MRIRNKEVKRTPLLALMVAFMLIGTASALIYSNTVTSQWGLTAVYPLNLSWAVDPGNTNMFLGDVATGTLAIENLGDAAIASDDYYLQIEIVGQAGCVPADMVLIIQGDTITLTGTGTLTATYDVGMVLSAGATVNQVFEFEFLVTAPLGIYDVSIYAGIP